MTALPTACPDAEDCATRLPRVERASAPFVPVQRLLARLAQLSLHERVVVWRVYRHVCRSLRAPEAAGALGEALAQRVHRAEPYLCVSLGLKLAQAHRMAQLRAAGAGARVRRALIEQALHLARMQFRASLGMRQGFARREWSRGTPCPEQTWTAFSDGSRRAGLAGAGALWCDARGMCSGELSIQLPAASALQAELAAASLALDTLLALGARHVHLHVDSQDALCAFEQGLALRFCVEEAALARLAGRFRSLRVTLVPRTLNHRADRLAARAAQSA